MKLLAVDGKIYKTMVGLWNAVKLNFIWLVFSLPIITIGASTVAAFSVAMKIVENNEGHIFKQFMKSFKENFKQGILMGLIVIVVAYCAYLNFEFFNKLEDNPMVFLFAGIIILFFGLLHVTYAFPLMARYKNSIFKTFSLSKEIAIRYFLRTLLVWVLVALFIVVFIFNYTLMFIGALVGPVSIFLIISSFSSRFFTMIEKDNQSG